MYRSIDPKLEISICRCAMLMPKRQMMKKVETVLRFPTSSWLRLVLIA